MTDNRQTFRPATPLLGGAHSGSPPIGLWYA